jgi:hypothetical protein
MGSFQFSVFSFQFSVISFKKEKFLASSTALEMTVAQGEVEILRFAQDYDCERLDDLDCSELGGTASEGGPYKGVGTGQHPGSDLT